MIRVLPILLFACGDLSFLGPVDRGSEIPGPVQAAFDNSCASADCHGSPFPPAGLDLRAEAAPGIVGRAASERPELPLVVFGDLQGSYMALKLLPEDLRDGQTIEGERMPLDGELGSADVAMILGWIGGAELAGDGPPPTTTTTSGTPSGTPTTTTAPSEWHDCSAWGAAAAVTNPVDYGEGAGQIPTLPGHILESGCGCHTVPPDQLEGWAFKPPDNGFRVNAIADWRADIFGVPAHEAALARVQALNMPPPIQCGTRSSGGSLTQGDLEVLVAWLEAGAPDAPAWNSR